ncbi:MAG: hypothetical protein J6J00_09690 [Treponema sp.]|nr:hypothetical protein [Treponema sp.]
MQNIGLILSAFLARLPVNFFDKAIAVFGGFLTYFFTQKIIRRLSLSKPQKNNSAV